MGTTSSSFNVNWDCVVSWIAALLVGFAVGPLSVIAFFGALWCAGFTTAGIVAGSMAAVTQSEMPLVAAGSLFSSLQSIGALGVLGASPYAYLFCSMCNMVFCGLILYYQGCNLNSGCACHN